MLVVKEIEIQYHRNPMGGHSGINNTLPSTFMCGMT